MAGTVLAEIVLEGDRSFRSALKRSGGKLEDVSGDAAVLNGALEGVADAMGDVVPSTMLAKSRVDELGDEFSDTARQATTAAGSTTGYAGAAGSAAFASGGLSTVMTASLIPAFGTLATIAGPLVGTLGAVAGAVGSLGIAFGTVIGTGILAWGEKLSKQNKERLKQVNKQINELEKLKKSEEGLTKAQREELKTLEKQQSKLEDATSASGALAKRFGELKSEIVSILVPLGERFIPLIEDAVGAIPALVRRIVDSVGSLDSFRRELRRLGGIAMDVIPSITKFIFDLARRALPVFRRFVDFIRGRAGSALESLGGTVERTAPLFFDLADAVVGILPGLMRVGTVATETLVPVLTDVVEAVGDAISWFTDLPGPVKRVAIVVAGLAPVIAGAGTAVVGLVSAATSAAGVLSSLAPVLSGLTGPIGAVVLAVGALAAAFITNFAGVRDAVMSVVRTARREFQPALTTLRLLVDSVTSTIRSVWERRGGAVMSQIRDIVSLIERSLKEAIRTLAPLVNEVLAGLTEFWAKHGREVTTVVVDTILVALDAIETGIRAVRTTVGTVLGVMEDIWDAHGTQLKTIIRNVWSTIDGVVTTGLNNIRSLLRAATAVLEGDWDTAWSSIKTIVDRTISGIQSFLRTEGKAMLTAALTIVTDAAASVWRDLKAAVIGSGGGGGIVGDLISSVTTFISGIGTEDVRAAFRTLGSAIRNVFLGLFDIGGTAWSIVTDFVDWFVGYIGSGKAFSDFKTAVTTLLSAVESVWSDYLAPAGGRLWSIVTDLFDRFVTYVGSGEAFGDLRAAFGGLMDMIFAAFEGLYNGLIGKSMIPDMFKDIRDYVAGAGKGMLRAAFDGVRRAIERALNSIGLGGIMDALRGVAKEANNLLDTIDSIPSSIDVDWPSPPDWLNGGDNGDEDGDDEDEDDDDDDDDDDAPPRNPREGPNAGGLAEGGYVTGPTAAWVGEGSDDEFVTPASTMERILRETAREALRSAGSGGDTTIVVEEGAIHAPDADADEILDRLTRRLKYERTR